MEIFQKWYDIFLGLFPPEVQWLVSLIVVISLLVSFWVLIKTHWIFLLIFVVLLPITIPAFKDVFQTLYSIFLYIWSKTGLTININKSG